MAARLPKEEEAFFREKLKMICKDSRLLESTQYMQHGTTSVFRHSVSVAYYAYYIVCKTQVYVDVDALIRGALLHDYFLYDWHEKDDSHKWHGFHHAKKAWRNAMEDFELSEKEQYMILCHMFPLTPIPPKSLEGWILCYSDKVCSSAETAGGFKKAGVELVRDILNRKIFLSMAKRKAVELEEIEELEEIDELEADRSEECDT